MQTLPRIAALPSANGSQNDDTADQPRTAVALNFTLGWLRQQENQFLTLPPEKARELPDAHRPALFGKHLHHILATRQGGLVALAFARVERVGAAHRASVFLAPRHFFAGFLAV